MNLAAVIREKPDWQTKLNNKTIIKRWKKKAAVDDEVFEYVLAQLKHLASLEGPVVDSTIEGVWQADDLIPQELREALLKGVSLLENVPDNEKDWHPGTSKKVLDLVHPSLFCFVAGVTPQLTVDVLSDVIPPPLKTLGSGKVVHVAENKKKYNKEEKNEEESDEDGESSDDNGVDAVEVNSRLGDEFQSYKYQWLPADFQVSKEGKVSILSYINNLHPVKNAPLYDTMAKIFELFVPIFEKVLSRLASPRRILPENASFYPTFGDYKEAKSQGELSALLVMSGYSSWRCVKWMWDVSSGYEEGGEDEGSDEESEDEEDGGEEGSNSEGDEEEEGKEEPKRKRAKVDNSETKDTTEASAAEGNKESKEGTDEDSAEEEDGKDQEELDMCHYSKLRSAWQFEVKVPYLPEFTPYVEENPITLNGRRLQVIVKLANIILTPKKKLLQRRILARGGNEKRAYCCLRKITESILHFRTSICEPDYQHDDRNGVEQAYGLADEDPLNQNLGGLVTKTGRAIAFPNLYQHYVAPFSLKDKKKPGHRKILVFYLVDPAYCILSLPNNRSGRRLGSLNLAPGTSLPTEIVQQIFDLASPMTLEDAKQHREALMMERSSSHRRITKSLRGHFLYVNTNFCSL